MVYRIYVERKNGFTVEADKLLSDFRTLLGIGSVESVRVINRYDAESISEENFKACIPTVFSEPQTDLAFEKLPEGDAFVLAVEYLPGQYDQRADSAAQCIQIAFRCERPIVRTARIYMIYGDIGESDKAEIKKYLINPVECREATLDTFETLDVKYTLPQSVATLDGFITMPDSELKKLVDVYALAMDGDDIAFCRDYFRKEGRDPTITELRMIDTYWSDHCRHTTFLTTVDGVEMKDAQTAAEFEQYKNMRAELGRTSKPMTLMDIATIGAKYLKKQGLLEKLDESEEINACTVKIDVKTDNGTEKWLLLFKNETHNHPTEIEPFGGAATCIGGAIRDPLSGRSYVYQAMRVTGAADPTRPISETIKGKLPQRKIVTTAAAGYSSYGNQIGLATGIVDELYHDGYAAKRMEIGAVIGAAPEYNVIRERPEANDIVVLLGGKTGRDGCGGATGSSKSHTSDSLSSCGAEVQKGNAPEERKLQRLFRDPRASRLIKRCNDFGAGGVSVAIGELADGLYINLNAVPKKYDGLDGTELAISESQERMAVVLAEKDVEEFLALASGENLQATVVARVTEEPRLKMEWNGKIIVDLSREFLSSNGAEKHINIEVPKQLPYAKTASGDFKESYKTLVSDLNVCSKRGLSECFDSTIGAGTLLMPFGGKYQRTPIQAMAAKIPVFGGKTETCSIMSWGFNPFISSANQFHGAYLAVVESVSKLVATGGTLDECYLTFQEYFEKPAKDPKRWGKPFAALLGALKAQRELGIASIGGKDSMSGSFEKLDVPPTLVSFAVTVGDVDGIVSPEFKEVGSNVYLVKPETDGGGLPKADSLKKIYKLINAAMKSGAVKAAYTCTYGGIAEGVFKMAIGNNIGFEYTDTETDIFAYSYGSFILESAKPLDFGTLLGTTTAQPVIKRANDTIALSELVEAYESKLEGVFPTAAKTRKAFDRLISGENVNVRRSSATVLKRKPRILVPVFPGTNCEFDTAAAIERAGGEAVVAVINNLTQAGVDESVSRIASLINDSEAIFIPGGFSGGDEPDGSGKFITAFFRNNEIKEAVNVLLKQRDGLMCGICNGFQALIKLGLVPYGEITDATPDSPTLTFNTIGRHQSKLVRIRVASNNSPWLSATKVGDIYTVPISHGEGRFVCPDETMLKMINGGNIATQYVDLDGNVTFDTDFNPNGSYGAVEGIISADGRVFGKMGHSERIGKGLYANVSGNYDMKLFESAVKYYTV